MAAGLAPGHTCQLHDTFRCCLLPNMVRKGLARKQMGRKKLDSDLVIA